VRFVPQPDFTGQALLDFRAWDQTSGLPGERVSALPNGGSTSYSEALGRAAANVLPPNRAPVLGPLEDQTITLGQSLTFTVTASDEDGDTLTFWLAPGAPPGAAIDPVSGVFTWTPALTGTYTVTVGVSDDGTPPLSDEGVVLITVNEPPNRAPVLGPLEHQTVALGQSLTFTVTASDEDGDALTFWLAPGAPPGAAIDPVSGVFTWTPALTGTFTVTVGVSDDGSPPLSNEGVVVITVSQPPPPVYRVYLPLMRVEGGAR
jgi:hypothetical protein